MSTAMQHEEEDVNLNEPIAMGDMSDQEISDLLPKSKHVKFEIKQAKVRARYDDDSDKSQFVKRLALQVAIADGIDDEGKYKNKRLFPEYVISFTSGDGVRESEWWKTKARGPAVELFVALGYDQKAIPTINQDFLDGLEGKEFYADITQREIERKTDRVNDKGKVVYEGTGDYINELKNPKKVGEAEA